MPTASVLSVNVGTPQAVSTFKRTVTTAIWKTPVDGRVQARGVNLDGDDQADRRNHGGPDKAVYAYASEDTAWWEEELGRELGPGAFGENLTLRGVDCTNARVGERWAIGTAVFEVVQPRIPCFKLGLRLEDPRMLKRFAQASRPGAYLRIHTEGDVGAGDAVEILDRPEHGGTMRLISDALMLDEGLRPQALRTPGLIPSLQSWLAEQPV
ncbi:MAG TPA: MOSC domain-containing protein [Solirubrobacteraceae bacterium]|nr:MOSC domain-containing protein [Solirubrobacteraceae bacterium]